MPEAAPKRHYILLVFTVISWLWLLPAISSALPSNRIKNITFERRDTLETLVVFLENRPEIKYFLLHHPERLVVDIKNAFVPQVNIRKDTQGKTVKSVRIGQNKKSTARIVLEIDDTREYTFTIEKGMSGPKPVVTIQVSQVLQRIAPVIDDLPDQVEVRMAKIPPRDLPLDGVAPPPAAIEPAEEAGMTATAGTAGVTGVAGATGVPGVAGTAGMLEQPDPIEPADAIEQAAGSAQPVASVGQETLDEQANPAEQETDELVMLFDDALPDDIFNDTGDTRKASPLALSGILQMRATLQTRKEEAVENNTSLKNRVIVEAKYKKSVTVSALADYLYFGSEDKTDAFDLDLHEAKWQHTDNRWGVSIGRQIIRWGKTDQISPVDTLNPEDMREFILPDYEERKLPVWMADLNLFFDHFTLEGVYIPFFEASKLDYFQTNWAVFKHLKKELQGSTLPPALKNYFNNLQVHEKDPGTEAEFGVRLTTTVKNMDLGLTFHHTTEDIPYIENFPVKNISVSGDYSARGMSSSLASAVLTSENIEVEYKRTNIAGLEFETTLGDFGVRGEAAWQENVSFLTDSLTSVRKPVVTSILGADYTFPGNTYINLQVAHRHIADYTPDILFFDQDTLTLIGEINRNIFFDWLNASVHFSKNLNNSEWYLSPRLKYTYITNLECILGAGLFSGDSDTWFGSVKDNDLFFFDIAYRF